MNEQQLPQPIQVPPSNKKPLIIGLAVLVLLATTGYAVYAWQQSKIAKLDNKVKDLQAKVLLEKSETSQVSKEVYSATPKSYELLIPEWKVKITGLNEKTHKNLGYKYVSDGSNDSVMLTYTDFRTDDDCYSTELGIALGRSTAFKSDSEMASAWNIKKIGEYYYTGSGAPGLCEENQQKLKDGRQSLSEITEQFKTLTAY